jgi:hypothetical protein
MQARQKRTAIRRVVLGNMGGARREAGGENLKYTLYRACELHRIPSCIALATPGRITQVAMLGDHLYVTDYHAQAIRKADKLDGSMSTVWAQRQGQHPWGLLFDAQGAAFWCTSANRILTTVGSETVEWAGAGGGIATPLGLAIGPDGLLYCASLQGAVTVWKTDLVNPDAPVRTIHGPEVRGAIAWFFVPLP